MTLKSTGDGTENPQGDGTQNALTTEQVNQIFTARIAAFQKSFTKELTGVFETTLNDFEKKIAENFKPAEPAPTGDNKKATESPEFIALRKQLEDQDKRTKAIEAERDNERKQRRDISMRDSVKKALAEAGFTDSARADIALGHLVDSAKAIRLDDDDDSRILFKHNGEELPLVDGLRQWVKSDVAKFFLPAKNINGSGANPGNGPRGIEALAPSNKLSRAQIGAAIMGMGEDE